MPTTVSVTSSRPVRGGGACGGARVGGGAGPRLVAALPSAGSAPQGRLRSPPAPAPRAAACVAALRRSRTGTACTGAPVSTIRSRCWTTSSSASAVPATVVSQRRQAAWSTIRYSYPSSSGRRWRPSGIGVQRISVIAICEPNPAPSLQRVPHRIASTHRQVQLAQLRIRLFVIGHRRNQTGLQRLDGDDVLHAGAHRVSGEALGIGDDDGVGVRPEHPAQRVDLGRRRCRRAPACTSRGTRTRCWARWRAGPRREPRPGQAGSP